LEDFTNWVANNKEWLFSGLGITILALIWRVFFKGSQGSSTQKIRSGDNSINIQTGRDVKFNNGSKKNDMEKK
jgi:hypothetical protein